MTAATIQPTAIERRQFGDDSVHIAYLRRGCHLTVAPFEGGYRIGVGAAVQIVDADGLRACAEKEREARAKRAASQRARSIQAAGRKTAKGRR